MRRAALPLLLLVAPAWGQRPSLAGVERWACFYGANLSAAAWRSLELAIVDPDSFALPRSSGPLALAYVSVGEADERRSFWPAARGKPFLVEANPDWPAAHRVDMRDASWRSLVIDRVVPQALAKGYAGVMLDTIDVAEYLESSAPARFAGSAEAAVALVRELRARHPKALIVVNNGLALLDRIGPWIDAVLVEDLYTRCLPSDARCRPTPPEVSAAKQAELRRFTERTGKPVLVLLYSRLGERRQRWVREAARRARRAGFKPYLASPSLERLGEIAPLGP